jgi:glycosyltransferase involved in cell wall biosynthesis
MSSTKIQVFVDEKEFDFSIDEYASDKTFKLDAGTSVTKLKRHFFETIAEIGTVRKFQRSGHESNLELACALSLPDTIVACFHELPPELPCRLLQHTKGGLMLTGGFLSGWIFRSATMNLVETARQKQQLEKGLGAAAPLLGVFAQRLATDIFKFRNYESNRRDPKKIGDANRGLHLIYAGRFIPNKGFMQVIRALEIWPISGARLTMVGDFEGDFQISNSGGDCSMFNKFFFREGVARTKHLEIKIERALSQSSLVKLLHLADGFVYPSFHEDEASGNAAHEAVLAGLPAIVTDWCGLGQLGRNTRAGALPTYATLAGVRYSIRDLRDRILKLRNGFKRDDAERDSDWVKSTFDPHVMRASLKKSLDTILKRKVGPPQKGGWRCPCRLGLMAQAESPALRSAITSTSAYDPEGLYVDGLGYNNEMFSEASLLSSIQGLYTTYPHAPIVKRGAVLHGFWRVALFNQERAIVEFGFPGPRLFRFKKADWSVVVASANFITNQEIEFRILDDESARILQPTVDLGYLVPHSLNLGSHDDGDSSALFN